MSRTLLIGGGAGATSIGSGRYLTPFDLQNTATEANAKLKSHIAGTFSKFAINFSNAGSSAVVRFRKNGANGNQVISPPNSASGLYFDNVNFDTVADGDDVNLNVSSGTPGVRWVRNVFESASNHVAFFGNAAGGIQSGTKYARLYAFGVSPLGAPEANEQMLVRAPGTFSRLLLEISANSSSTATAFTFRKNGANGNQTITVSAGATGLFEDAVNTDAVVSGDLVNIAITGHDATVTAKLIAVTFTNTETLPRNDIATVIGIALLPGGSGYLPIMGNAIIGTASLESQVKIRHGFPGRNSKMRFNIPINTLNGGITFRLRKNGANGNQIVTVPAGSTGWFEDGTNTDDFGADDDMSISLAVAGTSGSALLMTSVLTEAALIVASVSDSLACVDGFSAFLHPPISGLVADSLATADVFSASIRAPINAGRTDALTISDSRSVTATYNLHLTDGLALSDHFSGTRILLGAATITDHIVTADIFGAMIVPAIHANRTDTVALSDAFSASIHPSIAVWQAIGERRESLFPN